MAQSMMQNYDTSSGLGSNFHELAHGVDCPFHSSYLDTVAYMDRDAPLQHPQSVCIWEQDTGSPLRRHYTQVDSQKCGCTCCVKAWMRHFWAQRYQQSVTQMSSSPLG